MAETIVDALRMVIEIGATFEETITWKDANGMPVSFPPGTAAEAKVRPYLSATAVLIRFATSPSGNDGQITLTDPGVAALSLSPAQTSALLPVSNAVFDLKYTFPDGRVVVKLDNGQGLVDIREVSTRP